MTSDDTTRHASVHPVTTDASADGDGNVIVVGVDESEASTSALNWAAQEARRVGAGLLLVHAWQLPPGGYGISDVDLVPTLQQAAGEFLAHTQQKIRHTAPDLTVNTVLVNGDPALVLRQKSTTARLTVIGAAAGHRFRDALLGSVSYNAATRDSGPVLLVHPGDEYRTHGMVVVGVDDSDNAESAWQFAAETAVDVGADLLMVHTYLIPGSAVPSPRVVQHFEQCARRHPGLHIQHQVEAGSATEMLVRASVNARMVVVGTHGRHGITGLLLGSTSHAVIASATCPVAVIPPGP